MGQNVFALVFLKMLQAGSHKRLKLLPMPQVSLQQSTQAQHLPKALLFGTNRGGLKFLILLLRVLTELLVRAKNIVHVVIVKKNVLNEIIATFSPLQLMEDANCTSIVLLLEVSTELLSRKALLRLKSLASPLQSLLQLPFPQHRILPTCLLSNPLQIQQHQTPVFNLRSCLPRNHL